MTQYTHTGLLSNYRMTFILCFLAFILAIEFLTLNLVENIIVWNWLSWPHFVVFEGCFDYMLFEKVAVHVTLMLRLENTATK